MAGLFLRIIIGPITTLRPGMRIETLKFQNLIKPLPWDTSWLPMFVCETHSNKGQIYAFEFVGIYIYTVCLHVSGLVNSAHKSRYRYLASVFSLMVDLQL